MVASVGVVAVAESAKVEAAEVAEAGLRPLFRRLGIGMVRSRSGDTKNRMGEPCCISRWVFGVGR